MPATVLTGFFGKLPTTGDFVTRGLPPGFRAFWDRFCSTHLAPRLTAGPWPEGGLRLRLASGGRAAAAAVLPGQDSTGRRFPLAGFLLADSLPAAGLALDGWLDAAALVLAHPAGPDELWDRLDALEPPADPAAPEGPAILVWRTGLAPLPLDAEAPEPALAKVFAVSSG